MECNKDEAMRAKEIAEKKFGAKDFEGAKKFALKAQNLYPGLEGLSQMLATFDVYISASSKTNGESDWYSILGINPSADDETVKKQYRKLALVLHPDKNKSIGAEGAFQLISEALSMLSDKSNRALYDQRRMSRVFHQKAAPPSQERKAPPVTNGFHDFSKSNVSSGRVNRNASQANNPSAFGKTQTDKSDTFWTMCNKCNMQYEYLRLYCNQQLLCQKCRRPFSAIETPTPSSYDLKISSPWNSIHQQRKKKFKSASKTRPSNATSGGFGDANSDASFRWTPSSQVGSSNVAHAASAAQKTYEEAVREFEEALTSDRKEKDRKRKCKASEKIPGTSSIEHVNFAKKRRDIEEPGLSCKNQSSQGTGGVSTANASFRNRYSEAIQVNRSDKPYGIWDLSRIEISNILVEKARTVIWKKISADKSANMSNDATLIDKAGEKAHNEDNRMKNADMINQEKSKTSVVNKTGVCTNNISSAAAATATGPYKITSNSLSMIVPDSEFYDFDKGRTESSFQDNQVWAAYDNDDGMPRFYAIIHAVLSRNPFKVRISWLNSKTNAELGPLNWVGSGFSKTCGDFRVGRHEVCGSLNSFSHVVKWTKDTRGAIRIFPRKGDVWALYRNWSPDWNEQTPNEIIHKYDMVVVEDCDEELGVVVTPLVKVAGFKTVFRRQLEHSETKKIPKEEMFRFSHQVPRHMLNSQEASDSLRGCMELDPAATPTGLLRAEKAENYEENVADDMDKDSEKTNDLEKHEDAGHSKEQKVVEID